MTEIPEPEPYLTFPIIEYEPEVTIARLDPLDSARGLWQPSPDRIDFSRYVEMFSSGGPTVFTSSSPGIYSNREAWAIESPGVLSEESWAVANPALAQTISHELLRQSMEYVQNLYEQEMVYRPDPLPLTESASVVTEDLTDYRGSLLEYSKEYNIEFTAPCPACGMDTTWYEECTLGARLIATIVDCVVCEVRSDNLA